MGGGIGGAVNGGGGGGTTVFTKKQSAVKPNHYIVLRTKCSKTKPLHCTENRVQ